MAISKTSISAILKVCIFQLTKLKFEKFRH